MVELGMEKKQFEVCLAVKVEAFGEDMEDILADYFGPGTEGPITIISLEIKEAN